MHAAQAIAILALAGQTLAAPWNWNGNFWHGGQNQGNDDSAPVATDVAVVTAYTTVTWGGNWGQPTATAAAQTWAPPAAATPTAAPSSGSSSGSSGSSSGGYMGVVNEWRGKMGLSQLTESSKLQANALKTVQDGNGQMVHELNPGSMAQVLAPGDASDFENVFVGGWLCEIPSLPGLDGICSSMSQGWAYGGETGHADILKSTSYSQIGCALAAGIWGCDLA